MSRLSTWIVLFAGLQILGSGCAGQGLANAPAPIPLVGAFQVQRFSLDNGLNVLIVEDHSSPTFAYQTWFKVGSRDEVPGKTGLAHLFEHLMFKATKNHPEGEFDRLLDEAGAEGENAFTSWDYTAYVQEHPKTKLDLIASLESDRMVNLVVNEKSFRTELQVVQNERRFRNENNPDGLIFQELYGLAFQTSSYHWPVIGYQEDLDRMTVEEPEAFYKAHYAPNHATIVVAGDVNPDEVYSVIRKYYGDLKPIETPPHEYAKEPVQEEIRRKRLELNIEVDKLDIGYKIPPVTDADTAALHVADAVLAGGKSSRLYRALVDTGIAESVDTEPMEQKDPTLFLIEVNLQKGRKATQAEAVIRRELQKLMQHPIGDQEMERARNRMDFDFYEKFDGSSEIANFLGHYESLTGDFQYGLRLQEKIRKVTAQELQAAIRKYFVSTQETVITGVKK